MDYLKFPFINCIHDDFAWGCITDRRKMATKLLKYTFTKNFFTRTQPTFLEKMNNVSFQKKRECQDEDNKYDSAQTKGIRIHH